MGANKEAMGGCCCKHMNRRARIVGGDLVALLLLVGGS